MKKINIVGYEYKIKYLPKVFYGRHPAYGKIEVANKTIYIATLKRAEEEIFQTIMHECLHAIQIHLGIPAPQDEQMEESVVDGFASGLAQLFLNNKLLGE